MRYLKYIMPFIAGVLLVGTSCEKNDQRFDLKEINEATIETDTNAFRLVQYERLKIEPRISESIPGDTYTYEWSAFLNDDTWVLSTEKDLDVEITLIPNAYRLRYTIENTSTGVKSLRIFNLQVNGAFYRGWLVSHNQNNAAHLSFIRDDDQVFMRPAEDANDITFPGLATAAYHARFGANNSTLLFFTTQGAYRFDQNNFLLAGLNNDIIPNKSSYGKPAYRLGVYGVDQYIVDQGGVYAGFGTALYPSEVLEPFSQRLSGDHDLFSEAITTPPLFTYFYDNKHKRFMQVSYSGRAITNVIGNPAHPIVDMGNVGKTMIGADDRAITTFVSGTFYTVMEDEGGRYFLSISGTNPAALQKIDYVTSPDFDKATHFVASKVYNHMYYAAGNKVYMYNVAGNSAELVYEFPPEYSVTELRIHRPVTRVLAVGVKKGAEGEVYLFDIDNFGRFPDNTYSKRFTGFGEIAHLAFRQ